MTRQSKLIGSNAEMVMKLVCVFVCVCSSAWVGGWYWGHRVSGVCYGTEMDISEQEGAAHTRLFPCLDILDGVSLDCL